VTPCYTRHELLPGVHQDIPHEHEKAVAVLYDKLNDFEVRPKSDAAPCEAEERNKQALYLLENEWGCGRIDIGAMQRLLRGETCNH